MQPAPHEHETILEVEAPRVKFGRGAIDEVGPEAAALGLRRVALFTDARLARLEFVERARQSLRDAGRRRSPSSTACGSSRPTASFREAAAFARRRAGRRLRLGRRRFGHRHREGGEPLRDAIPAPFERYVNAPLGEGAPVPGPLAPHIACPTTSGTGSECTGIAIFDFEAHDVKTGIASRRLRPTLGIVDPDATRTLPGDGRRVERLRRARARARVVHREAVHAAPASRRRRSRARSRKARTRTATSPASKRCGCSATYLERAVHDAHDDEAREGGDVRRDAGGDRLRQRGRARAARHGVRRRRARARLRPAGVRRRPRDGAARHVGDRLRAVGRDASPRAPRRRSTAASRCCSARRAHEARRRDRRRARRGARTADARDRRCRTACARSATRMPTSRALVAGAYAQQRLLANSPRRVGEEELASLFAGAMTVW